MSILSRALSVFRSPADRRLEAAATAAFAKAPRPSMALALASSNGGGMQPPGRPPPINYWQEQPDPPARGFHFQPGYSDHTYQQFSTPLAFEGFVLDRIRAAVALHRLGSFYESWALSVAMLGFAPYLAALQQAVAPILDLDRFVKGGTRGLSRHLADEVREMLVPAAGLLPSPYLPPTLLATSIIYQRTMGFAVYQHVDGEPDPVTDVRLRYTRIWEPWAVRCNATPLKWLAITSEGEVEIKNDGKFTLVADEERPHLSGAIVALGEETLMGRNAQMSRSDWIYRNGQIKWVATLPEKIATMGEAGDSFYNGVINIAGPDGLGVLPYGSEFKALALTRDTSQSFGDTLASVIAHCAMVMVGSAGPLDAGSEGGVYVAAKGGKWNVRQDLIDRPTIAHVRAINQGHVEPWLDINYAAGIASCQRVKTWTFPAYDIPLDDPESNARIGAIIAREKARCEIVDMRRASGIVVTQDDSDRLSEKLDVDLVVLAEGSRKAVEIYAWEMEQGVFAPDEARAIKGHEPLPGGSGSVEALVEKRALAIEEQKLLDDQRKERLAREAELAEKRDAAPAAAPAPADDTAPPTPTTEGRTP